jgi:hypothetical protein
MIFVAAWVDLDAMVFQRALWAPLSNAISSFGGLRYPRALFLDLDKHGD